MRPAPPACATVPFDQDQRPATPLDQILFIGVQLCSLRCSRTFTPIGRRSAHVLRRRAILARSKSCCSATMSAMAPTRNGRSTTVMELVEKGAMAVLGNHDNAVSNPREQLNVEAQIAIEWTRGELGTAERRFLEELPLTLQRRRPPLRPCRSQQSEELAICDEHVELPPKASLPPSAHITILRSRSPAGALQHVGDRQSDGVHADHRRGRPIAAGGRRWLAVLGSVGQPRDGNPAASYAMLDTEKRELTYCRAPYDVEAAAAAIRKNGPADLARRPVVGGSVSMVKPFLELGATIDGFRIEECLHQGGMATLWRVSRPGTTMPMLMKVPRICGRRRSGGDRQLRDGADDPAALVRRPRAEVRCRRRFCGAALHRDGAHPRKDAVPAAPRAPFALCGRCRHRRENRRRAGRSASAACDSPRRQAEQHHVPADRRGRSARFRTCRITTSFPI